MLYGVFEADSPQPAAASAAPSAPGQPLVISGESPAAAPLPHIGELTDASVDVSLPPRKNAAAAVEVDCRASVSVVHPVNVVRGEEVHFLQLHPPSSKWKKRQIILEEDKIVYTDTSLYKAKRILVKLSPFTAVDVQEETYNPPSPWTFTLKIDGELENGYRSEVVLAFNNENVRVLWKDYLKHVISRLKAASDVDEYSNAQNVRSPHSRPPNCCTCSQNVLLFLWDFIDYYTPLMGMPRVWCSQLLASGF
jgi:hypothetical protein